MRKILGLALAAALTGSAALAADLNIRVESNGLDKVEVGPGAAVPYQVLGRLSSDADNEGLALFGLNLVLDGGDLSPAIPPTAYPMDNFTRVNNLGIANPDGYGGTIIGADLIQVGGGQNTILNGWLGCAGPGDCPGTDCVGGVCDPVAPFPIGPVNVGVALPQAGEPCGADIDCVGDTSVCRAPECWQILVTGSLTAPAAVAKHTLAAESVFANIIQLGEGPDGSYWATEAAGVGGITDLSINVVGEPVDVTLWESEVYHGVDVGDVALEIAVTDDWVEPRDDGIKKIRVTFDGAIDPLTAIPGNVSCAGCDVNNLAVACTAMTVTTEASDTELVIEFDTTLPDYARYKIELTGITNAGGSPVGGDTDRVLYGLVGDAGGNQRVTNADLSYVRPNRGGPGVYVDPTNVAEVRSDVNSSGRVTNADLSLIRSVRDNDARDITCP